MAKIKLSQLIDGMKKEYISTIVAIVTIIEAVINILTWKVTFAILATIFLILIFLGLMYLKKSFFIYLLLILFIAYIFHFKNIISLKNEFKIIYPIQNQYIAQNSYYNIIGVGHLNDGLNYRFINSNTNSEDCLDRNIQINNDNWVIKGCRLPIGTYEVTVFLDSKKKISTETVRFKIENHISFYQRSKDNLYRIYLKLLK
jgi:hypothetical protein